MSVILSSLFIVIALWWLGTGVVLYLQHRLSPQSKVVRSALLVIYLSCFATLVVTTSHITLSAQLLAITAAIGLWGCIELSYYLGLITGVHTRPCPSNANTAKRFQLALGTSVWHELLALFTGLAILGLVVEAENRAGLLCFVVLWLMRWSAKLNLFFGVPNFNIDWLPSRLSYLSGYMRRAPVSSFYFATLICASLMVFFLMQLAWSLPAAQAYSFSLPAALLVLAVLEHLFLAVPIADTKLWNRLFYPAANHRGEIP